MTVKDLLIAAKAHLQKVGWKQGGGDNWDTKPTCAFDAIFGFLGLASFALIQKAQNKLADAAGISHDIEDCFVWNDDPNRTEEEVLATFDKAIASCEE